MLRAYLSRREDIITNSQPGMLAARALAEATDAALADLADSAGRHISRPWSLIALGGYGAGRLLPASDLDLLIVTAGPPAETRRFVEALLYPLWDASLDVGHQVRTRREQRRATQQDIQTLTATLTGRVIAGDTSLGEAVLRECARDARRSARKVLRELSRRIRTGSPYLLEPNLKEGAGGQRDFDELTWTSAVLAGVPGTGWGPLTALGFLSEGQHALISRAAERIVSARWELHRTGARPAEVFTLDIAEESQLDAEQLQSALADTHHILLAVREALGSGRPSAVGPSEVIDADALIDLLARGAHALPELERLAWSGALDRFASGLSALMRTRRPGLSHVLTVGAHCLACAAALADIPATDPVAMRSSTSLPSKDRIALVAAALTHDFGKLEPGPGHAERGAVFAKQAAVALGGDEEGAADAATLVHEHLLLAKTTAMDDLDDEDVILRVASTVRSRHLLPSLHLLTAADASATSPSAWSPWYASLVGTLVTRLDAALSDEVDGAGIAETGERVRAEATRLLANSDGQSLLAFVQAAPLRYLASRSAHEVLAHAVLLTELDGRKHPHDVRISVSSGPAPETFDVTVVAHERSDLFARVAGAFSLAGLDILASDAHGTHYGVALDSFTVRSATDAPVEHETWSRLECCVKAALADSLELRIRLDERAKHYDSRRSRIHVDVSVDASLGYATVVRVIAPDRVGLLYDVAHAISELGLDIRSARVMTVDGTARDVFRVVDADGRAPTDPGVLGHVVMHVRERARPRRG